MAKQLKDDEIRINRTCISINKEVLNELKDIINTRKADVSYNKQGDIHITFNNNGQYEVTPNKSKNQISINKIFSNDCKTGIYKADVNGNIVIGKKVTDMVTFEDK